MLGVIHGNEAIVYKGQDLPDYAKNTVLDAIFAEINPEINLVLIEVLMKLSMKGFLKRGKLNLALGNLDAYFLDGRTVDGENKRDLNRCIGMSSVEALRKGFGFVEIERQHVLSELLKITAQEKGVMFDVHCTQEETPKNFLLVPDVRRELAACLPCLGVKTLISGAYNPDASINETDLYVSGHGGLGVTIEAGWRNDSELWKIVFGVLAALLSLGMMDLEVTFPQGRIEEHFKTVEYVTAGNNFKFTRTWNNFDEIPAGTVYAREGNVELYVAEDSVIIFPKRTIVPGKQACLLGQKVGSG